ncbi:MAG TPA: glycosyltransferase family 87 protein [Ktedonobacterales bacterium]
MWRLSFRVPGAPHSLRRSAYVIGWAGLLLCLAVYAYWGVYLPLRAAGHGYDFTGPYEAAYALVHHAPLQVYDVPQQRRFNDAVLHLPSGPSDFRWTPQTAALLMPLGLLPYGVAHVLWFLLSQVALMASLVLLARCLAVAVAPEAVAGMRTGIPARLRSPRIAFAVLFCAAALCQPVTDSLRLGQSTPLLLLGFALLIYGEVFNRPVMAGVGLGLAILIKLFPAVLLVYYLWRGRYRLCGAACGFIIALTVLTLPLTGPHLYVDFVQAITTYQDQTNAGPVNLSLYHALIVLASAIARPGRPEPAHGMVTMLASLICAALFGVVLVAQGWPSVLRRYRRGSVVAGLSARAMVDAKKLQDGHAVAYSRVLATAWVTCAALLVEPIDWIFYYLLLLVPLVALLAQATWIDRKRFPSAWRIWLVELAAYLLATVPLPLDSRVAPPMSALYVVSIALRPVALLAVWGVLPAMGLKCVALQEAPLMRDSGE